MCCLYLIVGIVGCTNGRLKVNRAPIGVLCSATAGGNLKTHVRPSPCYWLRIIQTWRLRTTMQFQRQESIVGPYRKTPTRRTCPEVFPVLVAPMVSWIKAFLKRSFGIRKYIVSNCFAGRAPRSNPRNGDLATGDLGDCLNELARSVQRKCPRQIFGSREAEFPSFWLEVVGWVSRPRQIEPGKLTRGVKEPDKLARGWLQQSMINLGSTARLGKMTVPIAIAQMQL